MPAATHTATRRLRSGPHSAARTTGGGAPARAALLLVPAALALLLTGCAHTPATGAATDGSGGRVTVSPPSPPTSPSDTTPPATPTHPVARSVPVRLRIPAIGVDTPVIPLGLAADGSVGVPPIEAHSPAGWYDGSPTPGLTGPSVILGHVTVGQYGDGVFLHLSRLRAGDRITVGLKDGVSTTFTVDRVQTVAKAQFPTGQVYGNVDHPALRLITCGGARSGAGYPDNVVVYASLAAGT